MILCLNIDITFTLITNNYLQIHLHFLQTFHLPEKMGII